MTVKLWKDYMKRKGARISDNASPQALADVWDLTRAEGIKSNAITQVTLLRAMVCLKGAREAGEFPFMLETTGARQRITFTCDI